MDPDQVTPPVEEQPTHYWSTAGTVSYPPRNSRRAINPASQVLAALIVGILIGMLALDFLTTSSMPSVVSVRQKIGLNGTLSNSTGPTLQENVTLQETSAVITSAKEVSPAVVAINVNQTTSDFYGQSSTQEAASGSGFIISSNGLIMTNKHVVDSTTGGTFQVVLNDGRTFSATLQATDPLNDLAVLKINATGLPTVTLGDSDALQVGQSVLAIGNPLGEFQNSVSSGIISAKQRSISPQSDSGDGSTEQLTDLLQTDAAINPGNSGGPLVNLAGQVVGIDTAIASTTGGSVGIGFAIPIDDVKPAITSVLKSGKIIVPYLGVRYQTIDPTLQQADNLPVSDGALVSGDPSQDEPAVLSGSPAASAGLEQNDIITAVDGTKLDSDNTLQRLLEEHEVGEQVTLTVLRGTKTVQLKATLGSQGG